MFQWKTGRLDEIPNLLPLFVSGDAVYVTSLLARGELGTIEAVSETTKISKVDSYDLSYNAATILIGVRDAIFLSSLLLFSSFSPLSQMFTLYEFLRYCVVPYPLLYLYVAPLICGPPSFDIFPCITSYIFICIIWSVSPQICLYIYYPLSLHNCVTLLIRHSSYLSHLQSFFHVYI